MRPLRKQDNPLFLTFWLRLLIPGRAEEVKRVPRDGDVDDDGGDGMLKKTTTMEQKGG